MNYIKNSLVPNLWNLALILYLGRSLAEPLKYPFLFSFGLLVLSYSIVFILDFRKRGILKFAVATKEYILLGLFLIWGILISAAVDPLPIKSLINFLGILVFCFIYLEFKTTIKLNNLLKGWIFLAILIGLVGFLKWVNFLFDLELDWFRKFYNRGTSLASDYNIYSFYFILTIVIYLHALTKEIFHSKPVLNLMVLILFIVNTALTGSRRGIILLVFFFLAGIVYLIINRSDKNALLFKNLLYLNMLLIGMISIFLVLIPLRSRIIHNSSTKARIAKTVYRYGTIVKPGIAYHTLFDKVWPKVDKYENDRTEWDKYATYNNLVNGDIYKSYIDLKNEFWFDYTNEDTGENLLYNGDFRYGYNFWHVDAPDPIKHEIINTEYGKAIRVTRTNGNGFWPLKYKGREIHYYQGVTYTFKFKYRVIKGSGVPFSIGWWLDEGKGYQNNLPYHRKDLSNGWVEFAASYTFKEDQSNLQTFMNSQKANTVVEFTDIELTCDDTLNRPHYLDQILNLTGPNLLYNSNFQNGLLFWGKYAPDTIIHELIDTPDGKAVRVERGSGSGYWPLIYQGRELFYHKDLTYYFRFKFRVIQGQGTPFNIGWWVNNEEINPYILHKDIFPLQNGWFESIVSYQFKNSYYGHVYAFMNSQQANTIIDFTDIELLCNDTLNKPMYADENIAYIDTQEQVRLEQELADTREIILATRVARWKFAFELWVSEYSWSERLLGGGFDYLRKFGGEFYPGEDRIDYPHNPIVSAFLYSGILGGIFYIYFLALSFLYYWKYRRNHRLLFILYLITFAFIFISSDSHFNVPIFAMLSLVPFITRRVVKEKEQENPA